MHNFNDFKDENEIKNRKVDYLFGEDWKDTLEMGAGESPKPEQRYAPRPLDVITYKCYRCEENRVLHKGQWCKWCAQ